MADKITYPCVMQAFGASTVIVNMVSYGKGTVIGTGNGSHRERYDIGYYSPTWQMDRFNIYKPHKGEYEKQRR